VYKGYGCYNGTVSRSNVIVSSRPSSVPRKPLNIHPAASSIISPSSGLACRHLAPSSATFDPVAWKTGHRARSLWEMTHMTTPNVFGQDRTRCLRIVACSMALYMRPNPPRISILPTGRGRTYMASRLGKASMRGGISLTPMG